MEILHNPDARIAELISYLRELAAGNTNRETYDRHAAVLQTVTAYEVNAALDAVLSVAPDIEALKAPVSRFIRSCGQALEKTALSEYPAGHLLFELNAENAEIRAELDSLMIRVKAVQAGIAEIGELQNSLREISSLSAHYLRLQNELFPLFEQAASEHSCVKLMWAIEDDVLALQRSLSSFKGGETAEFWRLFGEFFLTAGALVYREQRILFPVAYRALAHTGTYAGTPGDTHSSTQAGAQHPGAFISAETASSSAAALGGAFISRTGTLTSAQLEAIFSVLPVDVAFIGADDRVKFYSDPPHRIFVRTPAVIGRLVQNCHPPKSVALVEEILRTFKDGSRDSAEFYLTMRNRFILIQYFAVRDDAGAYLGTLEVSQDATAIRKLEGEKRLL